MRSSEWKKENHIKILKRKEKFYWTFWIKKKIWRRGCWQKQQHGTASAAEKFAIFIFPKGHLPFIQSSEKMPENVIISHKSEFRLARWLIKTFSSKRRRKIPQKNWVYLPVNSRKQQSFSFFGTKMPTNFFSTHRQRKRQFSFPKYFFSLEQGNKVQPFCDKEMSLCRLMDRNLHT